jgi:hypothetical protein
MVLCVIKCIAFKSVTFHLHEIWYFRIIQYYVEKIQFSLKFDKNNEYSTWRAMYIYDKISLNSSLNEKCFRESCRENQSTHFRFSNFISEIRAAYGIMWKNAVEPYRPQYGPWALRFGNLSLQARTRNIMFVFFPQQRYIRQRVW